MWRWGAKSEGCGEGGVVLEYSAIISRRSGWGCIRFSFRHKWVYFEYWSLLFVAREIS